MANVHGDRLRLCFDLEGTLIDTFGSGLLISKNITKARNIIRRGGVEDIGIFSFAIYDDADRADFKQRLMPDLVDALGVDITISPTVDEMIEMDVFHTNCKFPTRSEWIKVRGKPYAFQIWANHVLGMFDRAILVDDVVPNMAIVYRDTNFCIEYINMDHYKIVNKE